MPPVLTEGSVSERFAFVLVSQTPPILGDRLQQATSGSLKRTHCIYYRLLRTREVRSKYNLK